MPHLRTRYLQPILERTLKFSPLVGVLGHRQVGKTTLLEKICQEYRTFDDLIEMKAAKINPKQYLQEIPSKRNPIALDECQLVPDLFPALKERVRKDKRPGQFLMSGSVRFTSRKAIRESLTGRIINLELLPFTLAELEEEPLSNSLDLALDSSGFTRFDATLLQLSAKNFAQKLHQMEKYFAHGGLPGVCFIRDQRLRDLKIEEQLRTLLDRDLRLIQKTTLTYAELKSLCIELAKNQGAPIDWSALNSATGISAPTLKKLIYSLEGIFLIRTVLIEGGRKGFTVFFEDQAEAEWLSGHKRSSAEKFSHFIYLNLRAQFAYRLGERADIFQYRTRGGAFLPFAFRTQKGVLGVLPVTDLSQIQKLIGSANSFLKTYNSSKVLILHPENQRKVIQDRILIAPAPEWV